MVHNPEEVIEEAITYVKKFGYIDDERYALHFIEVRKESKSRREILMLLRQKNLSAEKIEWAMEQSYGETGGDQEAILKILQKKRFFEKMIICRKTPRQLGQGVFLFCNDL